MSRKTVSLAVERVIRGPFRDSARSTRQERPGRGVEEVPVPGRVQLPEVVILQRGRVGVVPQFGVIPSPRRETAAAISNEFAKLVGVIVQVVGRRLDLAAGDP